MSQKIKFGTSGVRGIIGDTFTKETIQKIGFAFRKVTEGEKPIKIVIGFDNRFMGREFAEWFCEAACSEKIHATLMTVPVPTPYISYKAAHGYDYGMIITASHNPPNYSGIKVFLKGGKDIDEALAAKIVDNLKCEQKFVKGEFVTFCDDTSDYVDKVCGMLDSKKIKNSNLRVLFNAMNGSGTDIMKKILDNSGVEYTAINDNRDPYFGGKLPCPYPYNLIDTAKQVVQDKYHFGFALDGDGDRIAFIDETGKIWECTYLAAVFYYYFVKIKNLKGGLVKTFVVSNLNKRLCEKFGREMFETRPGFKFIGPIMESEDVVMAAELQALAFPEISLCKDGVAAAAFLVDMLANIKRGIPDIVKEIQSDVGFPSDFLEFAHYVDLKTFKITGIPDFKRKIVRRDDYPEGYRINFEGDYWCAMRTSGTEPVVRLYCEMPDEVQCNEVIETMEKFYNLTERQK